MKRAVIAGLLICGAAPLPAQVCDPTSTSYNAVGCAMLMKRDSRQRDRLFYKLAYDDRRRRWAQTDAQNPPVIVDSRPGHRIAPRRLASQYQGAGPKQVEASLEAFLAEFERVARTDPNLLLSLPHIDLATAFTWLQVRSYMVLRGLDDVSPELVREEYSNWRAALRNAANAKFLANAAEVQFEYERALIASMSLSAQWLAALSSGNQAAKSALRKTAEQNLRSLYRDAAALESRVRKMDSDEKFDLMARQDNMCPWDGRVTLLIRPPAARTEGDRSVQGPLVTPSPASPPGAGSQAGFQSAGISDSGPETPPLLVTSAPGRRFMPQQLVKGMQDKEGSARQAEAKYNQALDEAERAMRSQPSSLPPNHLATALAREAEVLFAIAMGYPSTSEEVPRKLYSMYRAAHASPGLANKATPQDIDAQYERSIANWTEFVGLYGRATQNRDLQAMEALQKRARQSLERSFEANAGNLLADLDRIDRQARTGRPRFNIGMRLFDFRDGEKFEYQLNAEGSPQGQLIINVNRISGSELQLTIHAQLGAMSLDREVKYTAAFGSREVIGGSFADNDLGRRLAALLFPSDPAQPGPTECSGASSEFGGRLRRLATGGTQCVNGELPLPISADSSSPNVRLVAKLVRYNPPADSTPARGPQ